MSLAIETDPRSAHAQAIVRGAAGGRSVVNNLITLYAKSRNQHFLPAVLRLFHLIPNPNVVSWTTLISAFSNSHHSFLHFISMLRHPTLPNQRTLATLFSTCASLPSFSFGLQLHCFSLKLSVSFQPFAASALINFYCKLKLPDDGRQVFDEIPQGDVVCYSTLIVGLAQNLRPLDALYYFADMRKCDFGSTMYSLSAALRASADVAAAEQCRIIHGHSVVTGLNCNVVVGTALLDGYGKCGFVTEARRVFDELMPRLSVIGWNAMMSGYAQQGNKDSVIDLFELMKVQGLLPDEYTFLAILTAFCNAGLANETEWWLTNMKDDYGLEPSLEHYSCLVGVFARVGRFDDAERIALQMPYEPDTAVWRTLLSACDRHGNADTALIMSKCLLKLSPRDDSAYVILANVLAKAGRLDDVKEVRKLMKDRQVSKEGGQSWIEHHGEVHVFLAGDRRHEMTEQIHAKLAELREEIMKLGYVPVWDEMFHEVGKGEKWEALWYHSEKLALAFGLVSGAAPPGKALRIVKNLRICRDCHEAFKYISRVVNREIIVRDANRYHKFVGGSCNCGDYW